MGAASHVRHSDPTRGAQKFARWLAALGPGGAARVAAALGFTPQAVAQWRSGATIPSEVARVAIERMTRGEVAVTDWWTRAQRAQLATLLERVDEWDM